MLLIVLSESIWENFYISGYFVHGYITGIDVTQKYGLGVVKNGIVQDVIHVVSFLILLGRRREW